MDRPVPQVQLKEQRERESMTVSELNSAMLQKKLSEKQRFGRAGV